MPGIIRVFGGFSTAGGSSVAATAPLATYEYQALQTGAPPSGEWMTPGGLGITAEGDNEFSLPFYNALAKAGTRVSLAAWVTHYLGEGGVGQLIWTLTFFLNGVATALTVPIPSALTPAAGFGVQATALIAVPDGSRVAVQLSNDGNGTNIDLLAGVTLTISG